MSATDLVFNRKALEKQIVSIYGKNFSGSLVTDINAAATGLPKGNVSRLNNLMEAVPVSMRSEVAISILNDIFGSGSRTRSSTGAGFVKAYEGLNRNMVAKQELFKYLPEGAMERFDSIATVATVSIEPRPLKKLVERPVM